MAGLVVRENTSRSISSYVIYSDDNARTWQVSSGRASSEGNESKIVELNDGNLLMSIRSNQNRKFNLSRDKGMTWSSPFSQPAIQDPNCNGDLIRYTSMTDGYLKNRLLHSIPYATNRSNLSVLLSYDEGETWPVRKTVYPGKSAYSSLTVLQDGTIGMYYEVGEYETYEMYFARFSLGWLTNGADRRIDVLAKGLNPSPWLEQEQPVFTLYPNPAENQVNISGITQKNTLIEIFNTQGQLVSRTQFEEAPYTAQISLQNFVSGMYFVKIAGTVMKLSVK
jgi:Neuraminidase (sialidase)